MWSFCLLAGQKSVTLQLFLPSLANDGGMRLPSVLAVLSQRNETPLSIEWAAECPQTRYRPNGENILFSSLESKRDSLIVQSMAQLLYWMNYSSNEKNSFLGRDEP